MNADAPVSTSLVEALYKNILGHPGDAAGVAYWSSQNLNAGQLLQVFSQSAEFVADTQGAVASFQQSAIVSAIATNSPPVAYVDLSSASQTIEVWGRDRETIDVTGPVSANTLNVYVLGGVTNAPSTGNPFLTTIALNAPSGTNIELTLQHPAGTSQPVFEGWAGQNTATFASECLQRDDAGTGARYRGRAVGQSRSAVLSRRPYRRHRRRRKSNHSTGRPNHSRRLVPVSGQHLHRRSQQ